MSAESLQSNGPLPHGGRLLQAAREEGIALDDWIDLSTGINPVGWPVPPVPAAVWRRLPEEEDGLEMSARDYYGAGHVLPVAGSQAAIQLLPGLLPPGRRVGMMHPSYNEHPHAWRMAGHDVKMLPDVAHVEASIDRLDVLLLVNPNNPTGELHAPARLLDWHARLSARGAWLVVDEAFMDSSPEFSLASVCPLPGLIVLRSLGKFFGLAGARVGFVLAEATICQRLAVALGPWTVTGPSRWVAGMALRDRAWQEEARHRLARESARLSQCLSHHGLQPSGGTTLFQWILTPQARAIHRQLRRQAVLSRLFDDPPSLRLGLPGSEAQWQALEQALGRLGQEVSGS